ncbi:MAG: efflux RND transporter periplasmic adaptor subunit [Ancrocorticia sp.]
MSSQKSRSVSIMSILRLIVWVLIAGALVKIAFFPTVEGNQSDGLTPGGEYGQLTVVPEVATITNSLKLEGTVQSDPVSMIKSSGKGTVNVLWRTEGEFVNEGDVLLTLEAEEIVEPEPQTEPEPTPSPGTDPAPTTRKVYTDVYAPISGAVNFTVVENQEGISVGDSLGTIQPPTFSAVAALTPDQMYRIQDEPDSATITIKNGPAPFQCTSLEILTPQSAAKKTPDTNGTGGGTTSGIEARCVVPADQKVFAGLQVSMDIVAGQAKDVLTLPASAVEGRYQKGFVYAPTEDPDKPEKIDVQIGITDGMRVQIVSGIEAGREVLEFIPGTSEMQCNPFTGEGC